MPADFGLQQEKDDREAADAALTAVDASTIAALQAETARATAAETALAAGGSGGSGGSGLVPLIVFIGESNSGGQALNSDLTTGEKQPRSAVQILNNDTMLFEDLHIGVNNTLDHYGLTPGLTHGWENGLAHDLEDGRYLTDQVYLVKCGQGGSKLSEWDPDDAYWMTAQTRLRAARGLIRDLGLIPVTYVWYSQGINDALFGTTTAALKTAVATLHARIRAELGYVPILMSELTPAYPTFTAALAELADEDPATFLISAAGLTLQDTNHWNAAGIRTLASRFGVALQAWGELDAYTLGEAQALAGNEPPPAPDDPIVIPPTGPPESGDVAWITLTRTTDETGGVLQRTASGAPAGGTADRSVNATLPFTIDVHVGTLTDWAAVAVFLEAEETADYAAGSGFLSGVYQFNGNLHAGVPSTSHTNLVTAIINGAIIRLTKSGADIVYAKSSDSGATFTDVYTHVGVLTGMATLYLRSLFVQDIIGQKVRVELAQ